MLFLSRCKSWLGEVWSGSKSEDRPGIRRKFKVTFVALHVFVNTRIYSAMPDNFNHHQTSCSKAISRLHCEISGKTKRTVFSRPYPLFPIRLKNMVDKLFILITIFRVHPGYPSLYTPFSYIYQAYLERSHRLFQGS